MLLRQKVQQSARWRACRLTSHPVTPDWCWLCTQSLYLPHSLTHTHTHSLKCSEVRAERGQEENDWHTDLHSSPLLSVRLWPHPQRASTHVFAKFCSLPPPMVYGFTLATKVAEKNKNISVLWVVLCYELIAKHEVKISENQAAGVVFRENQETLLFCGQQAESAFTCHTACDQRCLPLLCQKKSCGSIFGSKVWVQTAGQPIMFNISKSTCCLFSTCVMVMVLSDRKWTYLAGKLV